MTLESDQENKRGFAVRALPWLVAAGALVVYLLTLNPWVSLANLPLVAQTAGWTWQPELTSPAYFVVTYPLRWLPAKWIPLGLNLFSALCAVLTLAQLARTVSLLPHDRTHKERERAKDNYSLLSIRSAWVPPVVAALVCGLQLTFWENATNGTIEMFDLLLFAWVIRALLEYRIDGRESWLFRAALVYGVGMTNNFAMWGFLPVFIIALLWIRGLSFFNTRFLGRMVLFGLIGLSLYLLLPLVATLSKIESVSFWQALKANLLFQKYIIFGYPKLPTRGLENLDWTLLVVVCVLPVLLFSIRWPSYFGDTSQLGIWLATIIFHLMFGLYLCVCLWCLLDAPFSPRHHGLSLPFLTFYYLAALAVGYFIGYFLLVFSNMPVRGRLPARRTRSMNRMVSALVLTLGVVASVGLVLKNLPNIRANNGPIMKEYAAALAEGFPKQGVLLSDDPRQLYLAQAWLARAGREKDFLPLDTHMDARSRQGPLDWPSYHQYLHQRYPDKWKGIPDPKRSQTFNTIRVMTTLLTLSKDSVLCYLQPSFGFYFELFYREPHELTYWLKQYGTNSLLPPPLSDDLRAENENFWARMKDQQLKPVLALTIPPKPGATRDFVQRALQAAHVPREPNTQVKAIGAIYSRALNGWAVEMQKNGDLGKAAADFELAQQLNPDNIVVKVNREYNQNLRAGHHAPLHLAQSVTDSFGKFRRWDQALAEYGSFDEPGFCYAQGYEFMGSRLYRQAAVCFDRARALSPTDAASRMRLAQLNLRFHFPDKSLDLIREIQTHPKQFTLSQTNHNELLVLKAQAHFLRNEPRQAVKILDDAIDKSPTDEHLLSLATTAFFQNRQFSNAIATVNRHLKMDPNNPKLLVNQGVFYIYANACDEAIHPLTRALAIQTNNYTARLYRAISYLRSDHLDDARKDYETLERAFPTMYQIYYGLGEIAYRRKETNSAINYYEAYLTNAVPSQTNAAPNPKEIELVANRLAELKGGTP